tara:strand:+ start:1040 stop:1219 length:180 start_codon:yes stop_codon:yes gene_type:complete
MTRNEALDVLFDALTEHVNDNLNGSTYEEGDTKHPYYKEIETINQAWKEISNEKKETCH